MSVEKYKFQNTQEIKKLILKFLEILESAKDLEFEQIEQNKRKYILKNAPKLQKVMENYGFGISNSSLQGLKDTKMINHLQSIFSTKTFFNIYTKNDLGLAFYTKVIIEIENFLDEIEKHPDMIKKEHSPKILTEEIGRDVFVIHGRNLKIKNSMFEFLQNLDLHPVPFEEAKRKTKEGSPYNLNVLRKAITKNVTVLALITPDDIGFLNPFFHTEEDTENEKRPMGQARSNVIFETGFALAINPTRTILVVFGNVRKYSDIAGINYFYFVDTPQKRNELKELLRSIGCPIRENPNYLKGGNFEIEPELLKNIPNSPNYSSTKSEIINSVKILRDLSIKIVRNEYNDEIDEKFKSQLSFIHKFPEVEARLPNYLSQESDSLYLHKSFKTKGSYNVRVDIINSDFDLTLKQLKTMNF